METTEKAPEIFPGYPYKRRVWPAWQEVWNQLRAGGREYQDGTVIFTQVAQDFGLNPATLRAVMIRAANVGLLERESRTVEIMLTRVKDGEMIQVPGHRARTHYRIKG